MARDPVVNLVEYPDREMMMMDLANILAGEINGALMHEDRVTFAAPGGSTPGPVFDALCAAQLDWSRVRVVPTDERWVPEASERSNARLLRKRLLVDRAAAATLIPLFAEGGAPEDHLDALAEALRPALPISVLLLGMGADGHVASLFPGADRLDAALAEDAPPLMAMRAPGAPEPRVSLTLPVLRNALRIHILITGREKRETLERARRSRASEMPVSALLSEATVHWAE